LFPGIDIWRFTTYWTLIFIVSIYTLAGCWACLVFGRRHYKWAILLPLLFFITGAFIAFISGSLVGKTLMACSGTEAQDATNTAILLFLDRCLDEDHLSTAGSGEKQFCWNVEFGH